MVFLRQTTKRIGRDMPLREQISASWCHIQGHLFPWLQAEVGPLTDNHKRLVTVLEMVRVEAVVSMRDGRPGRPLDDRHALARAFIAKSVLNLATTAALIERLHVDTTLRRLVGWERAAHVPSEATFSRAFAEFADGHVPERAHEALIERTLEDHLIGHIARDATAIEAREKPDRREKPQAEAPKRKRGRPRKGEVVPQKEPRRIERQTGQTLSEMLADLPTACDVGTKRNAKGYKTSWTGYKLHIDTADGDIPITCLLTSASLHDSQVAIPLATLTAGRVTSLYDLMDSAYDAPEIAQRSHALGHVPIIDKNPRSAPGKAEMEAEARGRQIAGYKLAEQVRYNERSAAERVNARLKDEFGGRNVRVRGHAKVLCHLMFGVLALTCDQLMRLII